MKIRFQSKKNIFSEEQLFLFIQSPALFNEVQIKILPDNFKHTYGYSIGMNLSNPETKCEINIEQVLVQKIQEISMYFEKGFTSLSFIFEIVVFADSKAIDRSQKQLFVKSPWGEEIPMNLFSYKRPLQIELNKVDQFLPKFHVKLEADANVLEDNLDIELYLNQNSINGELTIELSETNYILGPFSVSHLNANTVRKLGLPLPFGLKVIFKKYLDEYMLDYPEIILNFILEYEDTEEVSHKRIVSKYVMNPWHKAFVEEKSYYFEMLKASLANIDMWNKEIEFKTNWSRFSISTFSFQAGMKGEFFHILLELAFISYEVPYNTVKVHLDKINNQISTDIQIQNIDNYFAITTNISRNTLTKEKIVERILEMLEIAKSEGVDQLIVNFGTN